MVKMRKGWDENNIVAIDLAQIAEKKGAKAITIHGRTRSQMYSGQANWTLIRKLKENVDIPVFANGDIVSIDTAIQALEESQADGIAIGRGILSDASLIHRVEHYLKTGEKLPEPTLEEKIEMLKWLLDEEIKLRGEEVAIKFCRKYYAYYLTGFQNAAKIRGQLVTEEKYTNIIQLLNNLKQTSKIFN